MSSRFANKQSRVLTGIIVLAVVLRLLSALAQGNRIEGLPGVYDQFSYHALTLRVLDGHGFSFGEDWWPATRAGEPTSHWSYLYTLYLAAVYWLVGPHPLAARLVQAVAAGVILPWLAWSLGNRLGGGATGRTAAFVSAVYTYFVFYAGALMTETFYILAVLWSLELAMRIADPRPAHSPSSRLWLQLGLALGVAALLRQVYLLFAPFLLAWICWSRSSGEGSSFRKISWTGPLAALTVTAALIAPWTVRNYRAFDRFVLLNSNAGFAFFWGNHPLHGTDFVPILPADGPSYGELIPRELRSLDEAALDRALLGRGLNFVFDDPARYALLSLSRAKEYFKFWPSEDSSLASNVARVLSFGLFLPFMLYGLALVARQGLSQPRSGILESMRRSPGFVLFLFVTVYTLIHLLTWTLVRYRLPVDAVLVLFAAVGLQDLYRRVTTAGAQRVRFIESEAAAAESGNPHLDFLSCTAHEQKEK